MKNETCKKVYVCNSGNADAQLSEHFKASEFRCKDNSSVWFVCKELVQVLEDIRTYYGTPVHVNSGYRTYYWNNQIGGSTNSRHMRGEAADITVEGHKPSEVQELLKEWFSPEGCYGIGCYSNFTHIDIRETYTVWKE